MPAVLVVHLVCAVRDAHAAARPGEPFRFRGAARAFLEYAAYLTRLGLDDLAAHHTDLAAAAGDDGTAEQMSREEAAQVVQQMARLQETQELALQDSQQ